MARRKVEGMKGGVVGFEDCLDLMTMVQFDLANDRFGAFHNRKGKQDQFVFGFSVKGIHSFDSGAKLEAAFDNLEEGLKSMPPGESLRLHLISESNDTLRQQQLSDLEEVAPTEQLKYLIRAEKSRVRELSDQGLREPKRLIFYCTYSPNAPKEGNDWFSGISKWARPLWDRFTDQAEAQEQLSVEMLYASAYNDGYLPWFNFIDQQLALPVVPLSADQLWRELWGRFNTEDAIDIPQQITVTPSELIETVNYENHATALMTPEGLPRFDRQWVHVKGRFTGVLVMQSKPIGWSTAEKQLHYLWQALVSERNRDCEIICELTAASPRLAEEATLKLAKQGNTKSKVASNKGKLDIKAEIHTDKAVEAAKSLLDGQSPIYVSTVFLLHRDTATQLTMDGDRLRGSFRAPTQVLREKEIAWRLWLDTLPIVQRKSLAKVPTDRRQTYLSGEVPGVAPFLQTHSPSKTGFELVGEDGTPVALDFFKAHRNLGIFATTRAGKSVLVSGIITHALAHSVPVVALDYPKPDGSSTFTDYTEFMGENGAYFDISKESNNLFEMPDTRHLSKELRKERFFDYKDFLLEVVLTLVGVQDADPILGKTMKTIVNFALSAFFNDPLIQERYQIAVEGGFGSDDWQAMPTLEDFQRFCTKAHLPLDKVNGDKVNDALQQITLQIGYWLESRVGHAISKPSTFRAAAPLLVFALRNLSDSEDASILALSAYSAALRRAMEYPISIFFIDESPILFKFPSISGLVGSLCANGAKSGIRVFLSGQNPDAIANSPHGTQIFQNLSTRLIGRIERVAVSSFVDHLSYSPGQIKLNAEDRFFPNPQHIYSRWLLDDGGTLTMTRYYPPFEQLAAVANNPREQDARRDFLRKYPSFYEGLTEFAKSLVHSIRTGEELYVEPKGTSKPDQEDSEGGIYEEVKGAVISDGDSGDRHLVSSGASSA